jgi:hypothetical protein
LEQGDKEAEGGEGVKGWKPEVGESRDKEAWQVEADNNGWVEEADKEAWLE